MSLEDPRPIETPIVSGNEGRTSNRSPPYPACRCSRIITELGGRVLAQRRSSANSAVAIGERAAVSKMVEKLPNGSRLSCGAKLKYSQTEC